MENGSKRKQTFVNYVLEKLKTRLNDCAAPDGYKRCEYKYNDTDNAEEDVQNEQEHKDVDSTHDTITFNKKKKKTPANDSGRIYQASLPIEGLEVTREISDSSGSDSTDNYELKKRKRKRKRRHRTKKVIVEGDFDESERTTVEKILPLTSQPVPADSTEECKLSKKALRKEAKIASIRAGLKNEAHSLAKVWNNFFEARFTLVTETENVGDSLPESCNRVLTNTGCDGDSCTYDTLNDNELLSKDDLCNTFTTCQSREPSEFVLKNERSQTMAASFEDRYEDLEKSGSSCEDDGFPMNERSEHHKPESTDNTVKHHENTVKHHELESKDNTVKLTKNQKRKRKKKRRQFYLRKEEAERKALAKDTEKEQSTERFDKTKEEVIAFFDSMWDIFLQEKKERLSHEDLERMRLKLLEVFEYVQNLQQDSSSTFEMLVSIKKWLLLLDNNRARAVLQTFQLSDALQQDHKVVIKCLVEYWIADIAPSLGVNCT